MRNEPSFRKLFSRKPLMKTNDPTVSCIKPPMKTITSRDKNNLKILLKCINIKITL